MHTHAILASNVTEKSMQSLVCVYQHLKQDIHNFVENEQNTLSLAQCRPSQAIKHLSFLYVFRTCA